MNKTLNDTLPMESLDEQIINRFEKAWSDSFPSDLKRDILAFLRENKQGSHSKLNMIVAHQVGKLTATQTGIHALRAEIVWLCVLVKDMLNKDFVLSYTVMWIEKIDNLLDSLDTWQVANINF